MDVHGIDVSVVSLANPWLDFLDREQALKVARDLNNELEHYCATYEPLSSSRALTKKRLFAFGSLPLVPGASINDITDSISQIRSLPHLRGMVMGTKGLGKGLDDPAMDAVWKAVADAGLVVFVHPHYGIDGDSFGEQDNGHALALGLAFPFETTIAISRLILAGTLDRHAHLKLLIAHSAGALPALSSRMASCVAHDPKLKDRLQHDFRYYLGMLYYDAVAYGPDELSLVERVVARADKYESRDERPFLFSLPFYSTFVLTKRFGIQDLAFVERVNEREDLPPRGSFPGASRIMFGTDHPFFPPLSGEGPEWRSVQDNLAAIGGAYGWSDAERAAVYGGTAVELFDLEL